MGRAALDRRVAADCQQAAGAQHQETFELNADYRNLEWTQLLLPLFVTFYQDDQGAIVPVWVNGQTGQVGGERRASVRKAWRLTAAVAAIAVFGFLMGGLLLLLNAVSVASVVLTLSFFIALSGVLPIAWAWQFNQRMEPISPVQKT
jgi:hypothetical protein